MTKEIIIKVPVGILGLNLITNEVDFPGTEDVATGERIAREMEVEAIVDCIVAQSLLTEEELVDADIYYMGTKEITEGVLVSVDGHNYQLFGEMISENLN